MSDHWVEIEFVWDTYPDKTFHCAAGLDGLCHAFYTCECEEWYTEGIRDGKPFHLAGYEIGAGDEVHYGEWNIGECRYEDWFYANDEGLAGRIKVDVDPDWDEGAYSFVMGDLDARD